MRTFHCDHCGNPVFFENTVCGNCGHQLAYAPDLKLVVSLDPTGKNDAFGPLFTTPLRRAERRPYRLCSNYTTHDVCNWGIPADDHCTLCLSCRLTRVIPNLTSPKNKAAWYKLEVAKRRLVYSLLEHKLPLLTKIDDPASGLAFELKADTPGEPRVLTGHDEGVITLNIEEADDVEREKRRHSMHEPYRTLLGHFRHEIGHYYYYRLITPSAEYVDQFIALYGDANADYQEALDRHYSEGAPEGWQKKYVSSYATMHPAEDWAETFAHYLHIRDTLDTAAWSGFAPATATFDRPVLGPSAFATIIDMWLPVSWSLNMVNRSMGHDDLYPFVLPVAVLEKMKFIHNVIDEVTALSGKRDPVGA